MRAAITGAAMPVWVYLVQKAKTHLSRARDETGRCFEQRVAYRLGALWARGYRVAKSVLNR